MVNGVKAIFSRGYANHSSAILTLVAVLAVLNVVFTIRATRRLLSKDTYTSPQSDAKEPDVIFVFVSGSIFSTIASVYFTQDLRDTLFFVAATIIFSTLLHLGCRYSYKVYLMQRYCSDIVIEHQPEQVKVADRLDDRK